MENKKNKIKTGIYLFCCCLAVTLFSGCGENSKEDTSDQVYYHIQETSIPDPDDMLRDVFEEEYRISQLDFTLQGDSFYRIVQCFTLNEPYMARNYIQILEPPYQEWITEEVSWEKSPLFTAILNAEDRKLDLLALGSGGHLLTHWQSGDYQLTPVQDSFQEDFPEGDSFYVTSDGEICVFQRSSSTVTVLNDKLQMQEKKALGAVTTICGVLQEPESGELLWYGTKAYKAGIWRMEDGTDILPDPEAMGPMSVWYLQAAYTKEGELYLADNQGLWHISEDETVEVCHFSDRNYQLEELTDMEVQEDGSLLLCVKCDGEELLLRIEGNNEPLPEKQEITFATLYTELSGLGRAIDRFNRRSELYHVTAIMPEITEEELLSGEGVNIVQEFTRQIQMEVAGGRGPDLFLSSRYYFGDIDLGDMARHGQLQSIDGMLTDEDAYWPAALESGRIDGKLYGIPYDCFVFLTTYSESFTAGRESWTIEELMEAVRSTDAEMLQCGLDGTAIVLAYGLYDNDNKAYIDWENRVSHLTEEPFMELLEFAKDYADDEQRSGMTFTREAVQEGRTIAVNPNVFGGMQNFRYLTELQDIFQGEPSHLGFPRSEGNGIYVVPRMFYMNAQSDKKEGVKEFFQYLLSEENQQRDVSRAFDAQRYDFWLPVRLSALERSIELAVQEGRTNTRPELALSEEQEIWARFLIENARPGDFYALEIEDMIFEELEPFFRGQRTAEEAARILDNRVQLYLDEQ